MTILTNPNVDNATFDWVPLSPGLSFNPSTFLPGDSGYQLLLRVEPGTVIPRHRYNGDTHAHIISGSRPTLTNEDTWEASGDEPCIVRIEANGRVKNLDDDGEAIRHTNAATVRHEYIASCIGNQVEPVSQLAR